jgi:diphthine-ammonia ligase
MKFVGLVSGGKDSFYAIMESIRNGHELVACAHLSPRTEEEGDEGELESYMYQTAASECIPTLVEECLGVPLFVRRCVGRSKNTSLVYDPLERLETVQDEVEDLYELLMEVKKKYPDVTGISSGAILSTYQRTRIESVCSRLQLTPLGYLWRISSQRELLEAMLEDGIEAVLVIVAYPPGLIPRKHLNKTLGDLYDGGIFDKLKERFDFHVCGEGGEYETLVLDCPMFRKRLELIEVEIIENNDDVGQLLIKTCKAVEKDDYTDDWKQTKSLAQRFSRLPQGVPKNDYPSIRHEKTSKPIRMRILPKVKVLPGGLAHVSEIVSQVVPYGEGSTEAELAVLEANCIFETLKQTLKRIRWSNGPTYPNEAASSKDVIFVHLYLSNIDHFAQINKHYSAFFGTVLPPSRSCIAVGQNKLVGGRRVMLDCIVQRGSGDYMRIHPDSDLQTTKLNHENLNFVKDARLNPHHKLRSTLHVQTISHWAPVCVGPYSQANTLRSAVIFLAGMIGLLPGSMKLVDGGWTKELAQSWTNAASVLDALEVRLDDVISGVVYLASGVVRNSDGETFNDIWSVSNDICRSSITSNGSILPGHIDENDDNKELYGGFEDYETYKEVMASQNVNIDEIDSSKASSCVDRIPLLMISVPQMPVGAVAEVELICAANTPSKCIDIRSIEVSDTCSSWDYEGHTTHETDIWDMGYDGFAEKYENNMSPPKEVDDIEIKSIVRTMGKGSYANTFVTAECKSSVTDDEILIHLDSILSKMIRIANDTLKSASLDKRYTLHMRIFYLSDHGYDGLALRCSFQNQISSIWSTHSLPATSFVPVDGMYLSQSKSSAIPFLAIQIISANLVHMETEMWIHHNRS